MAHPVSPLAPKTYPELPDVAGVRFATAEAGIKYKNRTDVLLVSMDEGTVVAGVLTRSKCPSAAVDWCRQNLGGGKARALLVNSGNANAFTGQKGKASVSLSADIVSKALGVAPSEIFLASTGVIGEPLDAQKFAGVTSEMATRLAPGPWMDAAKAIMTTDTFAKVATATVEFDGVPVVISGIAKGSGMIAPDMATMLSFVFTDAPIAAGVLQGLLQPAIDTSFNAVTVDSDTSTSDTCLVFATGKADIPAISSATDPRAEVFAEALADVLHELAIHVVRDGEGATKMVSVTVEGATSDKSAFRIAQSIANSP
jgi:glutamate N-acetyltransferase/amino-acid N-acetyltransferase